MVGSAKSLARLAHVSPFYTGEARPSNAISKDGIWWPNGLAWVTQKGRNHPLASACTNI